MSLNEAIQYCKNDIFHTASIFEQSRRHSI
jgi:hypothetical protein